MPHDQKSKHKQSNNVPNSRKTKIIVHIKIIIIITLQYSESTLLYTLMSGLTQGDLNDGKVRMAQMR